MLAGLSSLLIPGLGQLFQGRVGWGLAHFALAFILWGIVMGWVIHIMSAFDAARYEPEEKKK